MSHSPDGSALPVAGSFQDTRTVGAEQARDIDALA
jgi:hypothetical protein